MFSNITLYALLSVAVVSLIELVGVSFIPVSKRSVKTVVFYLVSLATGALLSNVFINLIPESFEHAGSQLEASLLIVTGFVLCFLLEKVLKVREHNPCRYQASRGQSAPAPDNSTIQPVGYMSMLCQCLDNFGDGILSGITYMISLPVGIATTVANVLHEIPVEFGGFAILINAGLSRKKAIMFNALTGLVSMLGCGLVLYLGTTIHALPHLLTPVAAGMYVYIAAVGLIPEMHAEREAKRSVAQTLTMLLGIGLMACLHFV